MLKKIGFICGLSLTLVGHANGLPNEFVMVQKSGISQNAMNSGSIFTVNATIPTALTNIELYQTEATAGSGRSARTIITVITSICSGNLGSSSGSPIRLVLPDQKQLPLPYPVNKSSENIAPLPGFSTVASSSSCVTINPGLALPKQSKIVVDNNALDAQTSWVVISGVNVTSPNEGQTSTLPLVDN